MNADQNQPELFRSEPQDPSVSWLENLLLTESGWMTAKEILERVNYAVTDSNKRWVRQLASASEWILSGQRGYLHVQRATTEEVQHAAAWLESQGKLMSQRACRLRRNAHRILH